jgi:putative DNA primase/helicase
VPFQCLGFNRGSYYYLPAGSPQVVELTAAEHTGRNFLRLAPLWFWERNYPGERGANYVAAANALIRACERVGVYDESRVRGRGAWWDEKDGLTVLHMGDRIITSNGTATSTVPIHLVPPGHYIYEVAPVLRLDYQHPLSSDEACQLTVLLAELSWEQPISSRLLAGWLALAPICGAIEWRPHVFIVGAAGTGKTWVVNNIVRPVVGPIGLICQSETTEAGLRQTLGSDARPVIFDEAEGENMRAQARIQNVMALMRQSSSETGGTIIKGSMSGAAQSYQIRSCFLFSAINAGVHQHADVTRISILALRRNTADDAAEHFRGVSRRTAALLTREYISRLHARIYAMVPTIRANARTFAAAAAEVIGSQRAGDQVGTLLAGAYALRSDGLIDPQLARDWIAKNDWSDQKETQESTDEQLCVQRILTHIEVVRTGSGPREYAVGELLAVALGRDQSALVSPELAEDTLARAGILVDRPDNAYVVADHHPRIEAILRDSPWVVSWRRVLSRLPGASTTPHPRRFGPVARSRGTILPFDDARAETEFNFGKNRERAEQGSDEANRVPDSEY